MISFRSFESRPAALCCKMIDARTAFSALTQEILPRCSAVSIFKVWILLVFHSPVFATTDPFW